MKCLFKDTGGDFFSPVVLIRCINSYDPGRDGGRRNLLPEAAVFSAVGGLFASRAVLPRAKRGSSRSQRYLSIISVLFLINYVLVQTDVVRMLLSNDSFFKLDLNFWFLFALMLFSLSLAIVIFPSSVCTLCILNAWDTHRHAQTD